MLSRLVISTIVPELRATRKQSTCLYNDVLRIVANEGMLVVAAGLVIGFVASLGVTRLMSSLLYRVASNDASTLVAASVVLTAVAILACVVPVRRATRVDPIVALGYE